MVLFLNVKVGQYVEVQHKGRIICGTVQYKGHLNGASGEWIGVELEYPYGLHNGCWRGRQYFKCPENCGIFTHACNIRFRNASRRSRDRYHKVNDHSLVDEGLFAPVQSRDLIPCYSVSKNYIKRAQSSFESPRSNNGIFSKEERFPLTRSISRSVPAATMPKTGYMWKDIYKPQLERRNYVYDSVDFIPRNVSVPHYTMPHEALKRQVKRGGWEEFGLHRPRFMTV